MTMFRIRYELRGGHVHMRVFAGTSEAALGKCGDLVMREEEFDNFRERADFVEFKPEAEELP